MENKTLDNVEFDYYLNTPSYVKMIVDMLPEVSNQMKQVVRELYNYYMNRFDGSKINEIVNISSKYEDKLSSSNLEMASKYAEFIYENFINQFVFDQAHRLEIFDVMHENVRLHVGCYQKKQEEFEFMYGIRKSHI